MDENGIEGSEQMLAHIDRLFNSLQQKREASAIPSPCDAQSSQAAEVESVRLPSSTRSAHAAKPPVIADEGGGSSSASQRRWQRGVPEASKPKQVPPSKPNRSQNRSVVSGCMPHVAVAEESEDGAVLLANIDQLYNDIMQGGQQKPEEMSENACSASAVEEEDPAMSAVDSTMYQQEHAELSNVLEEVLWSALLLRRGSSASVDVQSSLLELLPPRDLANSFAACGSKSLSLSLLQRLSAELPAIHTALTCKSPHLGESGMRTIASLLKTVREARDHMLILASTSSANLSRPLASQSEAEAKEKEGEHATKKTKGA
jgi:hypothetical protein